MKESITIVKMEQWPEGCYVQVMTSAKIAGCYLPTKHPAPSTQQHLMIRGKGPWRVGLQRHARSPASLALPLSYPPSTTIPQAGRLYEIARRPHLPRREESPLPHL